MQEHTVSSFDAELKDLSAKLGRMGGLAERQLSDSVLALARQDEPLALATIRSDDAIDKLELEVEESAIVLIAKRQPMAADLREIVTGIKIASDLERIGDLAKNIAKRVVAIRGEMQPKRIMTGVEHMSRLAMAQLHDVLDAFTRRDVEMALDVWNRDSEIDAMYNSIFRELLTYMMEDPRNISLCTHLLFAAKNVERIGDHTTNVAENVHYLVKGHLIGADRPKQDSTSFANVEPPMDDDD
ncbi:MAG: phosphate signaling complex protein PhoU [Flavobacteriaceae bacterium]